MLVAVLVHLMTGEGRYLALAMDYTDAWVRRIEQLPEGAPLPAGFDRSGRVLDRVSHLNEWLIGGILSVLLDLHLITQESRYAEAARRVLARLVGDQGNMVEAYGCTTTSLASYRLITGDRSLDRRVLDLAETMKEDGPPLALTGQGFAPHQRLEWQFESASGPAHPYSGPLLCLAYQITGDPPYAARALGCSAQMLEMARSLGDEGRAHGCASGHTNGVVLARVLTVLYPLTMGMVGLAARGTGHHKPLALYRDAGGRPGLPDGVAALFDFKGSEGQPPGAWRVTLANTTDEPRTVRVVGLDGLMRRRVNGLPWVVARQGMEPSRATVHPWEEVTGISVKLAPGETRAVHLPMPPE
jgi:hypothetical protein